MPLPVCGGSQPLPVRASIALLSNFSAMTGIAAVPVAMLMIGGEFDLSSGVMIGTSGLLAGLLTTEYGLSMWPAILLTLAFAACIGLINGWLGMLTGLPSFIVTLAMFFSLRGINLGVTKALLRVTGNQDRLAAVLDLARKQGIKGLKHPLPSTGLIFLLRRALQELQ